MEKLKVFGVCCGNGVILQPFLNSKYFEVLGGMEIRPIFKTPANIQWRLNFKSYLFTTPELPQIGPDVIVGAPDCGHSSVLALSRAKKFGNARENKSLTLYFEAVRKYRPKYFLFENLPAILKQIPKEDFFKIFDGYRLKFIDGSVSQFGNSQKSRKRLIIIGINSEKVGPRIRTSRNFKLPKQELLHLYTVKELESSLGSLNDAQNEQLCNIREDNNTIITMFGGFKISLKDAQKRWNTELKGKRRWPTGEQKMVNAPGVYRNLPDSYPLTVRKGNREFNSKGLMMSPRERARIMGIPDSFHIWYDPDKKTQCINKGRITVTKTIPVEVITWYKKCLIEILKKQQP